MNKAISCILASCHQNVCLHSIVYCRIHYSFDNKLLKTNDIKNGEKEVIYKVKQQEMLLNFVKKLNLHKTLL